MNPQEEYWTNVLALRDAGCGLMKTFGHLARHTRRPEERRKLQRDFLETKACVLELDDLLAQRPQEFRSALSEFSHE